MAARPSSKGEDRLYHRHPARHARGIRREGAAIRRAVDPDHLWVIAGVAQRSVGVVARMAAGPDRLEGSPADVELHRANLPTGRPPALHLSRPRPWRDPWGRFPAMELRGKTVLLTGATGGLGRAIASAVAERGASLVLSSRKAGQLSELAGSLPDGSSAGNLVVAYEPVWAIGTGLTPTSGDVEQVHHFIRESLLSRFKEEGAKVRILYGGSVKPSNAAELMGVANVNGALVGGASLKAADFLAIAKGCP